VCIAALSLFQIIFCKLCENVFVLFCSEFLLSFSEWISVIFLRAYFFLILFAILFHQIKFDNKYKQKMLPFILMSKIFHLSAKFVVVVVAVDCSSRS